MKNRTNYNLGRHRLYHLILIFFLAGYVPLHAETFITDSDGNWQSGSTWVGNSSPGSTIAVTDTVIINHVVTYNNSNDLEVFGVVYIINGTFRTALMGAGENKSVFIRPGGEWIMCNAQMFLPIFSCGYGCLTGSNKSGNFSNNGGTIHITNSTVHIAQNWEDVSNAGAGSRTFNGGCLLVGENFSNKGSEDLYDGICAELGLHGSGSMKNEYRMTFQDSNIIRLVGSGNFENVAVSPNGIFGGPGSPDIHTLYISNGNLVNNAPWTAQVFNFCINGGTVSGSMTADFLNDVTNNDTPEACAAALDTSCTNCPIGVCMLDISAVVVSEITCALGDGVVTALISDGTSTPSCGGNDTTTYLWNTIPPQTNDTLFNLGPGTYTVTVTDGSGCTDTASVTLLAPLDCCILTVICPEDAVFECIEDVPSPDTSAVIVVDTCGDLTIQIEDDTTGTGCGIDTMFIVRTYYIADSLNFDTCTQVFAVVDNIAPALTCPANVTIDCTASTLADATGTATATDNCDTAVQVSSSDEIIPGNCPQEFVINRTWSATDSCGNTSTCLQTITVEDNAPPSITCPANVTVQCANQVPPPNVATVTASDNCDGTPVITHIGDVISNMTCTNRFIVTRTYQATDDCNNTSTCTQIITVFDNMPPSLTCPANVTVQCAALLPPANLSSVTVNDNCAGIIIVTVAPDVITNMTCANRFTVTRVYTATDVCGNSATCAQVLTVFDNTPPALTCPNNITVECANLIPPSNIQSVTATDNCGGTVTITFVGDVTSNMTCANRFLVTRTYRATDECGNSATCAQLITVFDDTVPTITCPANVTVECGTSTAPATTGTATGTDNCGGVTTITSADGPLTGTCPYTFTRIWTATDLCGNIATCTQLITIDDTINPVITCPANVTISCTASTLPATTGMPTTSDACDAALLVVPSDVTIAGQCPQEYTISRTWTATDDCGNSATCLQVIVVDDSTPPTITCPPNTTVSCANQVPAPNTGSVTSSDNCGPTTVTHVGDVISNMTCVDRFTLTRTYRATDACGNSATCAQVITVNDITPPVITCPPNLTINFEASTAPSNTGTATATDNCGGTPVVTSSDVTIAGICVSEYTINRTWTATDACGNSATCLQIIVLDEGCNYDLSLIKELNSGQNPVSPGDDVVFTITVTNDGLSPVGSITITDYIPIGFSLNDPDWTAGTEGSTGQSASIVLSIANGALPPGGLAAGQSVSVEITLQANPDIAPGEYTNTAEISSFSDISGNDVSNLDIDSDPDEDDLNDPPAEDDHDIALICVQPTPVILGDNVVCPGDTVTYSVDIFNPANTYIWILQNGGGVIIDQTDSTITILWQNQPGGPFVIQLTEVAAANCQATVFLNVFIHGNEPLACNDHINISLDQDCEFTLLSGMILEGELFGDDNYIVIIIDQNGDTVPNATLTFEHIGQTFTVKVMSECNSNSCWGTITVEDKLPPQIICNCLAGNPEPTPECEITCLDVAELVSGNIPEDLLPEATDNCGIATVSILNTLSNFDNCEGGFILVTWIATDLAGNTATCVQEFTIIPITLDSLEFPANYEGECGTSVHPDVTGWPRIDGVDLNDQEGLCNIFTGYWDKELAECGGGRKIVRTWTVLNWCTLELVEFVQIIKLTDTEGPDLTCPPDITVGTDFWYCYANVSVPNPIASDNCSDIVSFNLLTSGGLVVSFGNNFVINGLLIGEHDVTWVVTDECGNSSTCSFTITVIDDVAPVANCDHHTVVSLTNDGPSGITLVPASVFDDGSYDNCGPVTFRARRMESCIDFDWTTEGACIDHIPGGIPPVNSRDRGTVHRACVPFACCDVGEGPVMVELEVTDAAGNVNYCMVEVIVQDKISPFVECPPDIIVSCEFWFAFEEGTFTDAEGNNNGHLDEDPLSAVFGNMFDAFRHHESVRKSIIINDPGNHQFAQPHFWGIDGWADDNCEINLSVRVRLLDDCSGDDLPANAPPGAVRLIERRFSASDGNDGIAPGTCTQRIWVVDFEPFFITDNNCNNSNPNDGVIWPCDIVLTTCPDDLSGAGEPFVFDDACSLIGVAFEDTRFDFVDGACFKILRKWSVIDWCQYDPFTGEGLWMYTQVIKVHDHNGPEFVDCPDGPIVLCVADPGVSLPDNNQAFLGETNPLSSSCSAHLNLCETVIETCSEFVKYDVKIYPFNGSAFIQVKQLTTVPVDSNQQAILCFNTRESTIQSVRLNGIPYNSPWCGDYHRILWSVEDDCGNFSFCEYLFRLEDCKQPSPVCINGLSTVVMPSSGMVTIWAKDFDASSFDDCTPSDELLFSFSGTEYQPSFTYTCDNVPAFGVALTVHIWVADFGTDDNCNGQISWSERNKDFCTTTIVINDNENVCDTIGSILSGNIMTPNGDPVSPVIVSLKSAALTYPDEITSSAGNYVFEDVLTGYDYVIRAQRNDHHKNGVSTIDLVHIQKHLLGLLPFDSPYQYIAADANNSQNVSAIDLIEIRKLILGVYTEFPRNQSWRFIENSFNMPDPSHPWPFREYISLTNLQGNVEGNDFTGIKIGDVNGSAKSNATQILPRGSRRVLTIPASIVESTERSGLVTTRLIIPEPVIGFQWTLETDGLEFVNIHSDQIQMSEQHVGIISEGLVTMSWHQHTFSEYISGPITIYITWKASKMVSAGTLKMTNQITEIEGYTANEEILDLRLEWGGETELEFALYQNEPNPWNEETVISFELPEASDATLTIFDVTGKVVKSINGEYSAGRTNLLLSHRDLPIEGVMYYRLESKGYSATKKMIMIR